LDVTKRLLRNYPTSPQRLPPGYKKLSTSLFLVENLTDITKLSIKTPIVESEPSDSIPDKIQQVEMVVDLVLPLEGLPLDDTISKENENDIVQILFC